MVPCTIERIDSAISASGGNRIRCNDSDLTRSAVIRWHCRIEYPQITGLDSTTNERRPLDQGNALAQSRRLRAKSLVRQLFAGSMLVGDALGVSRQAARDAGPPAMG